MNPITPSNITAQPQAFNGANDLRPIKINFDALYVTNKGNYVRDLTYNLYAQIFTGQDITTLEGLGTLDKPSKLQQAFIDEQAAQCGYCINGIIMAAEALLRANPDPSDADIVAALERNLCRCGTHVRVLQAIQHAVRSTGAAQ